MEEFDNAMTIRDALTLLFERYGIPPDAYTAKSFTIPVGKIPIPVPNIPSRVKIARFHDVHHILTGYAANWKGEAEIGAWELATGCRYSFIAWFLNSGAVLVGLLMYPKSVCKAFIRGRNTRTNLYHHFNYETLLDKTIQEVQESIGLAKS